MSPRPDPAQQRFLFLHATRGAGAIVMLVGLVIWYSDLLDVGGAPVAGSLIFTAGLALSFLVPAWLARKWRTPPGS